MQGILKYKCQNESTDERQSDFYVDYYNRIDCKYRKFVEICIKHVFVTSMWERLN